jgi:uncharacterized membrane protein affecting hemolysin expression
MVLQYYFFGFINLKIIIENFLKVCFNTKSIKTKLKEIIKIVKKVIYNVLLISILNVIFMAFFKIIKFEKI